MPQTPSLIEAVKLHQQGHIQQAQQIYLSVLQSEPNNFDAKHLLGVTYLQSAEYSLAKENIEAALQINPNNAAAHSNLGRVQHETQLFEEALKSYDQAIALKKDFAEAHYNKGNALRELKRMTEATEAYLQAVECKSDYAAAYQNLGVVAHELRDYETAIAYYDKTIALQSTHAQAHSNRGVALKAQHNIAPALKSFDLSIAIDPHYAQAYWNKAVTLLLDGQYEKGWQLFEWGWQAKQRGIQRHTDLPLWTGIYPLKGKRILLHAEQGYGDVIQFCRYATVIHNMGATVWLEVPSSLVALMQTLEGVHAVIAAGEPVPEVDFQCPLMSLPKALKTTLANLPNPSAYLKADPKKSAHWQNKLADFKHTKVGLVWSSGVRPHQPEVAMANAERNVPLEIFAAHLQQANIDFFSLQKGEPAESELQARGQQLWPNGHLHNFTSELHNFADTAALIAQLDLVISVDTSTAHLAAAMGKPVWILVKSDGCWRWLLDIEHSPWYASARIFRQGTDRHWAPVLERVARDLQTFSSEPHRSPHHR